MGLTAENVAERWDVAREDMDCYAQRSQERAVASQQNGFFEREITPWDGVAKDDGPRAESTLEKLASLEPAFKTRRQGHRRQLVPAQRRRGRGRGHERHARGRSA